MVPARHVRHVTIPGPRQFHGPHPGAWESGPSRVGQRTEEIAVMLDTFKPLGLAAGAGMIEQREYVYSWLR